MLRKHVAKVVPHALQVSAAEPAPYGVRGQGLALLARFSRLDSPEMPSAESAFLHFDLVGLTPAPDDLAPEELAAWTSVLRVVLNLDETCTRN